MAQRKLRLRYPATCASCGLALSRGTEAVWEYKVYVGGRDRTKLAAAMQFQVDAVLAALRSEPGAKGPDVHAALCFVDSDWGLLDFPFQVGSVWVLYPGALRKRLKKSGALSREQMSHLAKRLALSLQAAA